MPGRSVFSFGSELPNLFVDGKDMPVWTYFRVIVWLFSPAFGICTAVGGGYDDLSNKKTLQTCEKFGTMGS